MTRTARGIFLGLMAALAILLAGGWEAASARTSVQAPNSRIEWTGVRHIADVQCGHTSQHKHRCTRVARAASIIAESRPQRRFFYPATPQAVPSHLLPDEIAPLPRAGAPPSHLGRDYRQMYAATRRMLN